MDVKSLPVPHLIITDKSEIANTRKRLKNFASRRLMPLHPKLVELDFLDFVAEREGPHVFADLPHGGEYEPTKAFSQWFGRHLRQLGIKSRTKVFPSFRHGFKDACRMAGMEEEVDGTLTGHANRRSVGRAYGVGVPIDMLATVVAKIDYGLSH